MLLLLPLSRFSRVRLCATPETAAHQAPPFLGFSRPRMLEWAATAFSNAWKWKVKVKLLSCVWLLATPWTAAYQAPPSMGFARQEYWSGLVLTKVPLNPRYIISRMHIYTYYRNLSTLVTRTADFTIRVPIYHKTIPYQKNCSVFADNAKLICSLLKDQDWMLGSKKNICKYSRRYRARKGLQK